MKIGIVDSGGANLLAFSLHWIASVRKVSLAPKSIN